MTALLPLPAQSVVRPAVVALLVLLCASTSGVAQAQTRGELLYATHCLACHNTQMHWREMKRVIDWPSLRAQVRQWQAADQLAWSDDDIEAVAQHLNTLFYRLPPLPSRAIASALPVPAQR